MGRQQGDLIFSVPGRPEGCRKNVCGELPVRSGFYQLIVCLEEGSCVTIGNRSAPVKPYHALLLARNKEARISSAEGTAFLFLRFDEETVMHSCLPALAGNQGLSDFFLNEGTTEEHLSFLEIDSMTMPMVSLVEMLIDSSLDEDETAGGEARDGEEVCVGEKACMGEAACAEEAVCMGEAADVRDESGGEESDQEEDALEDALTAQGLLCELLSAISRQCYLHAILEHGLGQEPFEKICAYMLRTGGKASLEEVAKGCFCHMNTVSRILQRCCGMGYSRFRQLLRISFAAKSLRGESRSVQEAAAQYGYSNMTNFYRQFREIYQIGPGQYRALFLEEDSSAYRNPEAEDIGK